MYASCICPCSPEMITAVEGKFAQERQTAKKEMEQKTQAKEAREKQRGRCGGPRYPAVCTPQTGAASGF